MIVKIKKKNRKSIKETLQRMMDKHKADIELSKIQDNRRISMDIKVDSLLRVT